MTAAELALQSRSRPPQPTPNKQRPTRFWSEKFSESVKRLSPQEVKLQEAIYELVCGEEDLVKDLMMIQKNYADPMVQLHIMSSAEVSLFHDCQSLSIIRTIHFG